MIVLPGVVADSLVGRGGDSESGNQLPPISSRLCGGVRLGERPTPLGCSDRREGERRIHIREMGTWRHIADLHMLREGL